MDAKTSKIVRADFVDKISALDMGVFEYKGTTKEGIAFSNGVDTVIIKAVVKKEDFDLESALEEKAEAVEKAAEKTKAEPGRGRQTKKATKPATEKVDVDNFIDVLMGK